jgi:hypothetical protein
MSTTRYVLIATLSLAGAVAPSLALILARKRLGALRAASWLVIWGVVVALGEHAMWAMRLAIHEGWLNPHSRVHYFMAGVYAAIGGVLLGMIARTLLREGRRAGWFAVLFALLVGGTLELVMNGPTGLLFQHGFSTTGSLPEGMALFGYPFAWLAALVIAFKPIFAGRGRTESIDLMSDGQGTKSTLPGDREGAALGQVARSPVLGRGLESKARRTR